jgi:multisubunit Na+/H+ antiporter MnhC subunit
MVILQQPEDALRGLSMVNLLGSWELDVYIGFLGFLFLGYYGIYLPVKVKKGIDLTHPVYYELLAPSLVMVVLSFGTIYKFFIRLMPIPLLTGERVTSRFVILPVIIVTFLAGIYFQKQINKVKQSALEKGVYLGLLFLFCFDMVQHIKLWRVSQLAGLTEIFPKMSFDPIAHRIGNHADPVYLALIWTGAIISISSLVFSGMMALRERRMERLSRMNKPGDVSV